MPCIARTMRTLVCFIAAAATTLSASAHDFWLEPSKFRPEPNQTIKLKLRVGDAFPGEIVPRNQNRIVQFVLSLNGRTSKPVIGQDGSETAGLARIEGPGLHVAGYQSSHAAVSLDEAKF